MRKQVALGILMAVGVSGPALAAEDYSYSFVEAGYLSNEIEAFSLEGEGIAFNGSIEFGQHMFVFANLARSSFGDVDPDEQSFLKTRAYSLGLGHAMRLGQSVDLVAGASYERLIVDLDDGVAFTDDTQSERGVGLSVGVRGRVAESLELTGNVKYTHFRKHLNDYTLSVGGRYYFTPVFAAGIDVSDNDDGTAFVVGLRYDFGRRQQ
jgi:hypothetical protein